MRTRACRRMPRRSSRASIHGPSSILTSTLAIGAPQAAPKIEYRSSRAGDLGRSGLQPVVPDARERPDGLAVARLLANRHVLARHEAAAIVLVADLDARQPLDVGDAVPARSDQATGKAVCLRQRGAVHLVAEDVVAVEGVLDRHRAREPLGDREVRAGEALVGELPRLVDRAGPESAPQKTTSIALLLHAGPLEQRSQRRARPARVPDSAGEERQAVVARALQGEVHFATRAGLDVVQ